MLEKIRFPSVQPSLRNRWSLKRPLTAYFCSLHEYPKYLIILTNPCSRVFNRQCKIVETVYFGLNTNIFKYCVNGYLTKSAPREFNRRREIAKDAQIQYGLLPSNNHFIQSFVSRLLDKIHSPRVQPSLWSRWKFPYEAYFGLTTNISKYLIRILDKIRFPRVPPSLRNRSNCLFRSNNQHIQRCFRRILDKNRFPRVQTWA